ncbi:MAG: iron-sulfur cluster carrier protein ApbC [Legionella sp.]|nr:iron-sulfur cluster carrier protein ApbC [Legionella sp.]
MILDQALETTMADYIDTLREPLLNLSIKNMGITHAFSQDEGRLRLNLRAGFPIEPLEKTLRPLLERYLQQVMQDVAFEVTFESCIRPHRTQMASKGLRGIKNTLAIGSGKGGVGKSTVALNLAVTLAKAGARVGLLDADIYGPSIPLMLGAASGSVNVTEEDRYHPLPMHGVQAMSIAYLMDSAQALIWRGPMLAKSLMHMLDNTQWDNLDYLLIDLPPGTGDISLSLAQKVPLTSAVVVTTPQNVATLDAQKALQLFEKLQVNVLGLIENMSVHTCSHCGHQESIFGNGGAHALSKAYQVDLLGQLPLDTRIQRAGDTGNPSLIQNTPDLADTWLKIALRIAIELGKRPLNYADKLPEIVLETTTC